MGWGEGSSNETGRLHSLLVSPGHTRTSMMRTLNSSGRFSPNEWLLPETKSLFQVQAERQKEIAQRECFYIGIGTWKKNNNKQPMYICKPNSLEKFHMCIKKLKPFSKILYSFHFLLFLFEAYLDGSHATAQCMN